MPKSILQINKFDAGIVNYHDPRDIPENALTEAAGVMCDISGKVRTMGSVDTHVFINDGNNFEGSFFQPGFGLFAFNADYNLSNNAVETKFLAIQSGKFISFYDGALHNNLLALTTREEHKHEISPIFYYIDGCLRVSDSKLTASTFASLPATDSVRNFKYTSKTWFPSVIGGDYDIPSSWYDLTTYIFPPSCNTGGTLQLIARGASGTGAFLASNTSGTDSAGYGILSEGSIMVEIDGDDSITGEFQGDSAMSFGCSFVYDDKQESPITNFKAADGTNLTLNTAADDPNHSIKMKVYVGFGSHYQTAPEPESFPFDPRLAGFNIYWTGDSLGDYDDPVLMAKCYFGTSDDDIAYFESHDGNKKTDFEVTHVAQFASGGVKSSSYLNIKKLPSLTYELLTGVSSEELTTAARFQSACVINRRAYIGGVKRIRFKPSASHNAEQQGHEANCVKACGFTTEDVQSDRMLVSPLNSFDIFPDSNFIDVAVNDGEQITALVPFADRILQFKNNNLYVINVSQDYEYLESENRYMGINHPYQVCLTEFGVAWVNRNGCYLYDGEQISNLILTKLNPTEIGSGISPSWKSFIGNNGMIGYLSELKQLIIFEDPVSVDETDQSSADNTGGCMIYDIQTGSWTRGIKKVSSLPKSNIVTNYDDSCMFISQVMTGSTETIVARKIIAPTIGQDGQWTIINIEQDWGTVTDFKMTIGSTDITDDLDWPAEAVGEETFREFITRNINLKVNPNGEGELIPDINVTPGTPYIISRPHEKILASGDPYNGLTLTFTNNPTATNVSIAAGSYIKSTRLSRYEGKNPNDGIYWDVLTNEMNSLVDMFGCPEEPFLHLAIGSNADHSDAQITQPPWAVIAAHCSIDMYWYNPGLTNPWEAEILDDHSAGFPSSDPDFYVAGGDGPFLNPERCQIYLTDTEGENIAGVSTFKYDTYLGKFGYHVQTNELDYNAYYYESKWGWGLHTSNYIWNKAYLRMGVGTGESGMFFTTGMTMAYPLDTMGWTYRGDGLEGSSGDSIPTAGGTAAHNVLLNPPGNYSFTWGVPSVVFRVTAASMIITILGDYMSSFNVGANLTFSGCTHTENNQVFVLSNKELRTPFPSIQTDMANMQFHTYPSTDWGNYAKLTILTFHLADQTNTNTIDGWDNLKTYGDHATITVATGTANLSSSVVEGAGGEQAEWNINFNRNGSLSSDVNYVLVTAAQDGNDYVETYTTASEDGDSMITDVFLGEFNNVPYISQEEGDISYPLLSSATRATVPKYDFDADSQSTATFNFSSSGTVIKIPGDWTITTATGSNFGYIREGSLFKIIGSTTSALFNYRIASIGTYSSGTTPITIATTGIGPGGGTAGGDAITIRMNDTNGSALSGDVSSLYLEFINVIRSIGLLPYTGPQLSHAGWILHELSVRQFNNAYGNFDSSNPTPIEIVTRDFDFGNPSTMKSFYKVLITYKASSKIKIAGATDGSRAFTIPVGDHTISGTTYLNPSQGWTTVELYLSASRSPIKARSFQLKIGDSSLDEIYSNVMDFELNDISIIYREI